MVSRLESLLSDYLALARELVAKARDENVWRGNFAVLESEDRKLRSLTEQAESENAFGELVAVTAEAFSLDPSNKSSNTWRSAVQSFFRRSGLYQEIFAGKMCENTEVCDLYSEAFTRTEVRVTYFAPLEFISFAEKRMDFGDFQVQRFSKDVLDQRLQQATCRIFYPWASIDTGLLAQYWFLTCSEVGPAPEVGSLKVTLDFGARPKYSDFPRPIEEALKRLVLFSWGTWSHQLQKPADLKAQEVWDGPVTFGMPFVISASDSRTDTTFAAPSTTSLLTHPELDPETGESLGEVPFDGIHLMKELIGPGRMTNQEFETFVKWADAALKRKCANYPFIDLAARFLVKGFFSKGLEQLLWNITAIEAALGENREGGLSKLLKSRVGLILGGNDEQRHGYAKLFGELYDFRCDLVHGKAALAKNGANQGHLGQAREIARGAVVWMLHYLDHVTNTLPAGTAVPKRERLLAALDAAPASPLLARLPQGFPQVPDWLGR